MKHDKKSMTYGRHPLLEALESDKEIDKIFIQRGLKGEDLTLIRQKARIKEVPVQDVPVEKLNKITKGNHQGVIAFFSQVKYYKVEDILPLIYEKGETPLFLILDSITDVRNVGAIARTALCTGVHAIIVPDKGTAPMHADAVKSSAGALNNIPVCRYQNLNSVADFFRMNGILLFAMDGRGKRISYEVDLKVPAAIIMGAEDVGVSDHLVRMADEIIKLPIIGDFDSYNVSVAAGMILYEAMRQRLNT